MLRLFTHDEMLTHLDACRAYIVREFGEENCSGIKHWRAYLQAGYHIRQAYGDFTTDPPGVLGMVTCILISHAELDRLKNHELADIEVHPWKPEDGSAVLFVLSVVSDHPGVASHCIAGLLDQLDVHPDRNRIDHLAVFCTGPQGYLMSEAFGLHAVGLDYQEGWPFMERALGQGQLQSTGKALSSIWNITKARDVVDRGRRMWGQEWRTQILRQAGGAN